MARYTVSHQTAAGADLPMINITGTAAVRVNLYDLVIGSDDTPADQANEFVIIRTTDNGTGGSALTESPTDPLTVAATSVALVVQRLGGSEGTVLVTVGSMDDTATAGEDYVGVLEFLLWNDNESGDKALQISILDDDRAEGNET